MRVLGATIGSRFAAVRIDSSTLVVLSGIGEG